MSRKRVRQIRDRLDLVLMRRQLESLHDVTASPTAVREGRSNGGTSPIAAGSEVASAGTAVPELPAVVEPDPVPLPEQVAAPEAVSPAQWTLASEPTSASLSATESEPEHPEPGPEPQPPAVRDRAPSQAPPPAGNPSRWVLSERGAVRAEGAGVRDPHVSSRFSVPSAVNGASESPPATGEGVSGSGEGVSGSPPEPSEPALAPEVSRWLVGDRPASPVAPEAGERPPDAAASETHEQASSPTQPDSATQPDVGAQPASVSERSVSERASAFGQRVRRGLRR